MIKNIVWNTTRTLSAIQEGHRKHVFDYLAYIFIFIPVCSVTWHRLYEIMISISLVRGQHECTKGPTQPPDTARWIWYKKTDSHTVDQSI